MVTLKKRLIKEFSWKDECTVCTLNTWNNKSIPLEIDHINGIHSDNRIENLRFICPNCHAQTDTYKGKNIKKKNTDKLIIIHNCIDCNNKVCDINTRCIKCNAIKNRIVERPSYIQLSDDCRIMTYDNIAKKYGVSRSSIKRWIQFYEKSI